MSHRWLKYSAVLSLLAALLFISCEQMSGPTDVVDAPAVPQMDLLSGEDSDDGESEEDLTLIEDQIPEDIDDLDVSKLIGPDGGQITLAGHTLTVPEGAVDQVTLFTMTVVTSGYVEVDLTAETELLGIEVSEFEKPLTLSLTYARSPNVPEDLSRLGIYVMKGDSHKDGHEPLESTVDAEEKVVIAQTDHFTGFCLAAN